MSFQQKQKYDATGTVIHVLVALALIVSIIAVFTMIKKPQPQVHFDRSTGTLVIP